jgi:hypothetical protein
MKFALVIAVVVLGVSGCAGGAPPLGPSDTAANTTASYDYKGDITRDGGTPCWYSCF